MFTVFLNQINAALLSVKDWPHLNSSQYLNANNLSTDNLYSLSAVGPPETGWHY